MAKKKKTEKPKREYTRRQLSQFQKQKRRQRILFIGGVTVIAAAIIIVLVGWLVGEYLPLHRTILKVNDMAFNTGYLIDLLRSDGVTGESPDAFTKANDKVTEMAQFELKRQGAEKLGITVDDREAIEKLEEFDLPTDKATVYFTKKQMLEESLRDHFDTIVPQSGKQVSAMMLMLDSERQANEIRTQLISGGNFTAIAEEFSDHYYPRTIDEDDPGLHPEKIYKSSLGASVPVEYAFSAGVGDWSMPVLDEHTPQYHGYWLIKVLSRSADSTENVTANVTANVHALYLGSEQEAEDIKTRLEAGEDLGALADEFSQYALSKDNHGVMNNVTLERNISDTFNNYVWNAETALGEWSDPIRDDLIWTYGGYWLVKVIEVAEDEVYNEQDRNALVAGEYSSWISEQNSDPDNVVEQDYLTSDLMAWIIKHL